MKPIEVRPLTSEELIQLDTLFHRTKDVRVRSRAQMMLLGAEDKMTAPQIAKIVRQDEQTVRRLIKRFNAEGISGLSDAPKSGAPGVSPSAIVNVSWMLCVNDHARLTSLTPCGPCSDWLNSWLKKQGYAFHPKPCA